MLNGYVQDMTKSQDGRAGRAGTAFADYRQTPPMFFSRDMHALYLGDLYRGQAVFLVDNLPFCPKRAFQKGLSCTRIM